MITLKDLQEVAEVLSSVRVGVGCAEIGTRLEQKRGVWKPSGRRARVWWACVCGLVGAMVLAGCDQQAWNNPYRGSGDSNVVYSSFSERPKHLDPARSYSSNEAVFTGQVYEPPLQYHFLKRPYQLEPLAAASMPEAVFYDVAGEVVGADAAPGEVAYTEYVVRIRHGVRYQPHPALAKTAAGEYRYHRLSAGDLEAVHKLSDFEHTGSREASAADFVFQIKRLGLPRLHSPIRALMEEHIVGLSEFVEEAQAVMAEHDDSEGAFWDLRALDLSGVEVVDRYTYKIRIQGVYPQFKYWLAMPFFAPIPWEAEAFYNQPGMAERNLSLDWYPIGTGAFMLSENNPNLRMVLERNPNFHGETYPTQGAPGDREAGLLVDAGKELPLADRAVYSLEKENIPYWNKFLQGYYDTSGVASDSFDQAVQFNAQGEANLTPEMEGRGIQLLTATTTSIWYLGFNMLDPVVGGDSTRSQLLRRAISIALDFEEYISIFANGRGVVAQSPLPPGIFGYEEGDFNPYVFREEQGRILRRPLEEARALLAEAGYAGGRDAETGEPLILYYDTMASGPDDKARLNWMRKQFAKLDIELVIRATDYNRFQEKMRKGTAQLFMWGWNGDYPDPENFYFLLHGPNSKADGAGENAANYRNPAFDALFQRMKNMENGPERQAVINEMNAILREEAPWVFGFHPKAFSLYHAWYHNVKPNLMANNTLKYKRVDAALREQKRIEWNPPVLWPIYLLGLVLVLALLPGFFEQRRRERRRGR